MSDFNQKVIEEFRANDGVVGGYFEHLQLLLLHHTGAKSGTKRVTPLAMQPVDNGWAVFASKGGASDNPAWYHNVVAHPEVVVETGSETVPARAYEASGAEYDRIWTRQKLDAPQFAEYEQKTTRSKIPVIVLERQ